MTTGGGPAISGAFTTRFAPSPTGRLHLGHAYSALTAWEAAQAAGGELILRIEDIDATRSRPAFEAGIYEDLAWLGLCWKTPVRRQSEHMADYRAALHRLIDRGLAYRCFRTRRDVLDAIASAPHSAGEVFRGGPVSSGEEQARLEAGEPYAWRMSLDLALEILREAPLSFVEQGEGPAGERGTQKARPERLGDIVLARKDVGVAYHLAVVVDDALQGVTHVVRGNDLFEATHVQRLLQALLSLPTPTYAHHPLILGPDGRRLAKRNGARGLAELRGLGVAPPRTAQEAHDLAASRVALSADA